MSQRYVIYTKPACPYCVRAKSLLDAKGIAFEAVSLETDEERLEFLAKLGGWRTFPTIFELDSCGAPKRFVGGFEALSKELG